MENKENVPTPQLEMALANREESPVGSGPLRPSVIVDENAPAVSPGQSTDAPAQTTEAKKDKPTIEVINGQTLSGKPVNKSSIQVVPKKKDMKAEMERQMVEYWTGSEMPQFSELKKSINYVIRGDGTWLIRQNKAGIFCIKHAEGKYPGFAKGEMKPFFFPKCGKIPFGLLQQIVYFFKDICDESQSEVYTQIFFDPNPKDGSEPHYWVNVPAQDVSSGRVEYKRDVEIEKEHILVCEIHSHNTMGAFFSGVDDDDEKNDRFYGVVGELNRQNPKITMSYVCGGKRQIFNFKQLFTEAPKEEQMFPQEWKKRVTRSSSRVSGHSHSSDYEDYEHYWNQSGQGGRSQHSRVPEGDVRQYGLQPVRGFGGTGSTTHQGSTSSSTASGPGGYTPAQRAKEAFRKAKETLRPAPPPIPATDFLANPTTAETEGVSANPFFSNGADGDLVVGSEYDKKLITAVGNIQETLLFNHIRGVAMNEEQKRELFKSLVSGMRGEDVSLFLDIVKEHGHEERMMTSLNMIEAETNTPLTVDSAL